MPEGIYPGGDGFIGYHRLGLRHADIGAGVAILGNFLALLLGKFLGPILELYGASGLVERLLVGPRHAGRVVIAHGDAAHLNVDTLAGIIDAAAKPTVTLVVDDAIGRQELGETIGVERHGAEYALVALAHLTVAVRRRSG